jgi:tetratricopeptide (TPR) repeat protein
MRRTMTSKSLLAALLFIVAVSFPSAVAHAFCVSGACFSDYHPSSSSSSYSSHRDNSDDIPIYTGPSPAELERQRKQKEAEERERAAESANDEGIGFAKNGAWDRAIASFRKALEYVPGDAKLKDNLKLARELKGKEKEAGHLMVEGGLDDLEAEARELYSEQGPGDVQQKTADPDEDAARRKAVAAERKRLLAREAALDKAIKQDVLAIGRLGFKRRAEDFQEWVDLSEKAREARQRETMNQGLDILASVLQDKMIEGFRDMDHKHIERLIKWLKQHSEVPIDELINVLRQAAKDPKRIRMAGQAKAIVDGINAGVEGAAAESREEKVKFYMTLFCDVMDGGLKAKWCGALKSEALWAEACVYNNAARRVSVHEVERLTQMTEKQLRGLKKLNEVIVHHVEERNEVRAKLKELR